MAEPACRVSVLAPPVKVMALARVTPSPANPPVIALLLVMARLETEIPAPPAPTLPPLPATPPAPPVTVPVLVIVVPVALMPAPPAPPAPKRPTPAPPLPPPIEALLLIVK